MGILKFFLLCLVAISAPLKAEEKTAQKHDHADVAQKTEPKSENKEAKGETAENTSVSHTVKAKEYEHSPNYVHKWIKFPKITGKSINTGAEVTFEVDKGQAGVVFFIASWCEACQQLTNEFKIIENRYKGVNTQFLYVFCHDTLDDAKGFVRQHGIKDAILATQEVLKDFQQPELPSTYLADRRGWLVHRYIKVQQKDFKELDSILSLFTAL